MSDPHVVECRGLSKSFGPRRAVVDVDVDVRRGEILALLGPSGCGKTTMLRLIAGFERPDAGAVVLAGRIVAGPGAFVVPERRHVAFVFQDYALFPHLTVADNVAYGLGHRRRLLRPRHHPARVDEMLDLVGLRDVAGQYPHELSGGMQQRVAIARALAPQPTIVLLDEPFSNLDAALRARVRDDVRRILAAADATTIFVTHDQEEALSLADRVAVMSEGRVHQVDTPSGLYAAPADRFVATFVGDAQLLPAHAEPGASSVVTQVGSVRLLEPARTGSLELAIRPEQVRLSRDGSGVGVVSSRTFYGHDQLVDVSLSGGANLRARLGPAQSFRIGERVSPSVVGPVVAYAAAE